MSLRTVLLVVLIAVAIVVVHLVRNTKKARRAVQENTDTCHAVVIANGLTTTADLLSCVRHLYATSYDAARLQVHLFVDSLPLLKLLLRVNLSLPGPPERLIARERVRVHSLPKLTLAHTNTLRVHTGVNYLHALRLALERVVARENDSLVLLPNPRACLQLASGWDAPVQQITALGGVQWLSAEETNPADDVDDPLAEALENSTADKLKPRSLFSMAPQRSEPVAVHLARQPTGLPALAHPEACHLPRFHAFLNAWKRLDHAHIQLCTAPVYEQWLALVGKSGTRDLTGMARFVERATAHPYLVGDPDMAHMTGLDGDIANAAGLVRMLVSENPQLRRDERTLATARDLGTCTRATTLEIILFNLLLHQIGNVQIDDLLQNNALLVDLHRGAVPTRLLANILDRLQPDTTSPVNPQLEQERRLMQLVRMLR